MFRLVFLLITNFVLISSLLVSMPLKDDMQATLKAELNVDEMNKQLSVYIQEEVKKGVNDALSFLVDSIVTNKTKQAETRLMEKIKGAQDAFSSLMYPVVATKIEKAETRLMEKIKERQIYAFFATLSKTWNNHPHDTILVFDVVSLNVGNAYSGTTGKFTCNEDGIYCFSWTILSDNKKDFSTALVVNDRRIADNVVDNDATTDALSSSSTVIVSLQKGDSVGILVYDGDYVRHSWTSYPSSMFSGFKIN